MSFAADTKSELCKQVCPYDCCAKAECYGILCLQSSFHSEVLLSVPNIEKLLCAWQI